MDTTWILWVVSCMPKEMLTRMPSDQTFLDHWTTWLATDAPRQLAPATVVEYKR